jgi:hypothetical protein
MYVLLFKTDLKLFSQSAFTLGFKQLLGPLITGLVSDPPYTRGSLLKNLPSPILSPCKEAAKCSPEKWTANAPQAGPPFPRQSTNKGPPQRRGTASPAKNPQWSNVLERNKVLGTNPAGKVPAGCLRGANGKPASRGHTKL